MKVSVTAGPVPDGPDGSLAADLEQETTELSVSGEPDQLGGSSLAGSPEVSTSDLETVTAAAGASDTGKTLIGNGNFRVSARLGRLG